MGGFESAVYRELDDPDSIGVYTVGKSIDDTRNEWFDEILNAFEDEGAEAEGYWLGFGGDADYDIEANVFEYEFNDEIDQDVKLLVTPKPGIFRSNSTVSEKNPLANYTSLAMKVENDLDSVFMKDVSEDLGGHVNLDLVTRNIGAALNEAGRYANLVSMKSASTGEEALLVKSSRFPYRLEVGDFSPEKGTT